MNILLLLIPLSLLLLGAAVWMFVWAVRRGQFDDLDTPPLDMLGDDDRGPPRRRAPPPDIARDGGDRAHDTPDGPDGD